MAEMKLFDQKMYDYVKEDFKKGGKHEKVFKGIMLFWFCVFIVLMIFCYQYYITPATAQVMDAYYVSKDASEYKVASYYIEVEVQGRVKNFDYETFVENVAEEYKDKFQDAFVLYVRFYSKYRLDPNTSKPDQRPIEEFKRYTEKYLPDMQKSGYMNWTTENDSSTEYEFHMTNAMDSDLEFDLENRYIMTKEEVGVRGIPDFSASVNRVVSYQIVDVYAVAYVESGKWALIGFDPFDAAHDNIGWVPVEALMEYSEENYQLLNYPVTIQEGCVDLKSGELIVENGPFRVKYMDGSAEISDVGSWSRMVSVDQIIYPPFEKKVNP